MATIEKRLTLADLVSVRVGGWRVSSTQVKLGVSVRAEGCWVGTVNHPATGSPESSHYLYTTRTPTGQQLYKSQQYLIPHKINQIDFESDGMCMYPSTSVINIRLKHRC